MNTFDDFIIKSAEAHNPRLPLYLAYTVPYKLYFKPFDKIFGTVPLLNIIKVEVN